jgi:hypothetical protein
MGELAQVLLGIPLENRRRSLKESSSCRSSSNLVSIGHLNISLCLDANLRPAAVELHYGDCDANFELHGAGLDFWGSATICIRQSSRATSWELAMQNLLDHDV